MGRHRKTASTVRPPKPRSTRSIRQILYCGAVPRQFLRLTDDFIACTGQGYKNDCDPAGIHCGQTASSLQGSEIHVTCATRRVSVQRSRDGTLPGSGIEVHNHHIKAIPITHRSLSIWSRFYLGYHTHAGPHRCDDVIRDFAGTRK